MRRRKPRLYKPRKRRKALPYLLTLKAPPAPEPPTFARSARRGSAFGADDPPPARRPWLATGLLVGATAALFAFSLRHQYLLGQIALPILGLAGLHGLWRGGFRKIIMLAVSVGLFLVLAAHPGFADPLVRAVAGRSSALGNGIACVLVLGITLGVVGSMVRAVQRKVILRRPLLRVADRLFGTGIGLAEGALAVLFLCWSTVLLAPRARLMLDHPATLDGSIQQRFAFGLVRLSDEIDESPLQPVARDANLLEDLPAVRDALNSTDPDAPGGLNLLDAETRRRALNYLRGMESAEGQPGPPVAGAPRIR